MWGIGNAPSLTISMSHQNTQGLLWFAQNVCLEMSHHRSSPAPVNFRKVRRRLGRQVVALSQWENGVFHDTGLSRHHPA